MRQKANSRERELHPSESGIRKIYTVAVRARLRHLCPLSQFPNEKARMGRGKRECAALRHHVIKANGTIKVRSGYTEMTTDDAAGVAG
jgi:hypothetical protein